jgi:hypothetical protein
MKAIFDERQWKHDPKHFMANGAILPNPEQPKRIEVLKAAPARRAACSRRRRMPAWGRSRRCTRRNMSTS